MSKHEQGEAATGSRRLARTSLVAVALIAAITVCTTATQLPAGAAQNTSPMEANISGQVWCAADPVTGVWIQSSKGGSAYANWGTVGQQIVNYSFSVPSGSSWTVHVGCGGGRSSWEYTPDGNTTTTRTVVDWFCYTPDDGLFPVKYYCDINGY